MDQNQNQNQIQIKAKDDDLKGNYSNMMQVSHTKEEFCLDFFNILPPYGVLTSRIFTSPAHFKRMIKALEENMKKYEQQFGVIEPSKETDHKIGFEAR